MHPFLLLLLITLITLLIIELKKTNKILYCKLTNHNHQLQKNLIKHSAQSYYVVQSKKTE